MGSIKNLLIEVGELVLNNPPAEWHRPMDFDDTDNWERWQSEFLNAHSVATEGKLPTVDDLSRAWYLSDVATPLTLTQMDRLVKEYKAAPMNKNDLPLGLTELDGEVYYKTSRRLFVLRVKQDAAGPVPVWAFSDWCEEKNEN